MNRLLALLLFLLSFPALAQIGPVGSISIGGTTITGGPPVVGDCLKVGSGNKLGQINCGSTLYPEQPYEQGPVVDTSKPWGSSSRYGMLCDGTTNWANTPALGAWLNNAMLPGFTATLEACAPGKTYFTGFTMQATQSSGNYYYTPGSVVAGIVHPIANGSFGTNPTTTCTTTLGGISAYGLQTNAITASIATNVLTVTVAASNTLAASQTLTGAGLPANLFIISQLTGTTGGAGTYTVSQTLSSPVTSESMTSTARGFEYFNRPRVFGTSNSSSSGELSGAILSSLMRANNVESIVSAGTGYAVNDTLQFPHGIVGTVTSVTSGAITGLSITTQGQFVNLPSATYANRLLPLSTSGSGTGAAFIVSAQVDQIVTTSAGIVGHVVGTTLTVENLLEGSLEIGQTLVGTGVSGGITVTALGTGTGGIGTYTISSSQTIANGTPMSTYAVYNGAVATSASVTGTVLTVTSGITSGRFALGQVVTGTGVTSNSYIISFGTGTGAAGTYNLSQSSSATGTITVTTYNGNGSGTPCVVWVDPPALDNVTIGGLITAYERLGIQGSRNLRITGYHGLSNAALSADGIGNPGGHIDYNDNLWIGYYEIDNTALGSGAGNKNGISGLSIDGTSFRQARATHIDRVVIHNAAFNGLQVCGDAYIGDALILGYGWAASNTATNYCGNNLTSQTKAHGLFVVNGTGHIDRLQVNQRDQQVFGVTTTASSHVLIASTGDASAGPTTPPFDPDSNLDALLAVGARGFSIDEIDLYNVSKDGGLLVQDPDSTYTNASLRAGNVSISFSPRVAMNNGGYGLRIGAAQTTTNDLAPEFTANKVEFLQSGQYLNSQTISPQPNAMFCGSGAIANVGLIRVPYHGSGSDPGSLGNGTGLFNLQCQINAKWSMDQDTNLGLPASGTPALFQFSGAGVAGSRAFVTANSNGNHLNQPFATFTSTTDLTFGGDITNYRSTALATATTNTNLKLDNLTMNGIAGPNGTALTLAGTLTDFTLSNARFDNWVTAITGTPTVAGQTTASNVTGVSNTTNVSASTAPKFTSVFNLFGQSVPGPFTVGTLPGSPVAGQYGYVTDADACVYGSTPLHTTGSTFCKVLYNGSAWIAN